MIVTILLAGLAVSSIIAYIFRQDKFSFYDAAIFAGLTILCDVLFSNQTGYTYYLIAAIFDVLILFGIMLSRPITELGVKLALLSMFSLSLNLIGSLFWELNIYQKFYELSFIAVYGIAIIEILIGSHDARNNKNNHHSNRVNNSFANWI